MIPELVESVNYQKGPYYAEDGIFVGGCRANNRRSEVSPMA